MHELRLHLDAAPAGTDIITATVEASTAFETLLLSEDMDTLTDLHWIPNAPLYFQAGQGLLIEWTNVDDVTYGIEVIIDTL